MGLVVERCGFTIIVDECKVSDEIFTVSVFRVNIVVLMLKLCVILDLEIVRVYFRM